MASILKKGKKRANQVIDEDTVDVGIIDLISTEDNEEGGNSINNRGACIASAKKSINLAKSSKKTATPSLTSQQQKCVGKIPPSDIIHSSYLNLHPPARPEDIFEDEEEQNFDEFMRIGKRNPNATGTGRWKLTKKRNKILVLGIGADETCLLSAFELKQYLEAFFQLEVDCVSLGKEAIDVANNRITFNKIGAATPSLISMPLRTLNIKPKGKKKARLRELLDVFSLFDALADAASEPYISCVSLIDHSLAEEYDGTVVEVMGRACGDRICCVSLPSCDSRRELLATATHEVLHTIGFDHCTSFRCVMNAIAALENTTLFLSPPNLRKMKNFHKIPDDDNGDFLIKRYEDMLKVLQSFDWNCKGQFGSDCKWLETKIQLLKRVKN